MRPRTTRLPRQAVVAGGEFALAEYKSNAVDRSVPIKTPPIGTWIHVVVALNGLNLELQWDGVTYTLANVLDVSGATRRIQIGMTYCSGNAATRVLYDNVRCTTAP